MNKKIKIAIYVLVTFLLVIIVLYALPSQSPQIQCIKSGGIWKELSDGCADFCSRYPSASEEGKIQPCTKMPVYSCDCGPDRCWDGNACTINP